MHDPAPRNSDRVTTILDRPDVVTGPFYNMVSYIIYSELYSVFVSSPESPISHPDKAGLGGATFKTLRATPGTRVIEEHNALNLNMIVFLSLNICAIYFASLT